MKMKSSLALKKCCEPNFYQRKTIGLQCFLVVCVLLGMAGTVMSAGDVIAKDYHKRKQLPERLRGINVAGPWADLTNPATFQRYAEWGVNLVRVNIKHDARLVHMDQEVKAVVPDFMLPYQVVIARLDTMVRLARQHGIFLIFSAASIAGRDQKTVAEESLTGKNKERFSDHLVEFWRFLALRYRDSDTVIGYDLLSELRTDWELSVWHEELSLKVIRNIRQIDNDSWLIIEPGVWGFPEAFSELQPLKDPRSGEARIMYSFHMYAPHMYTHQGIKGRPKKGVYPGRLKMFPKSFLTRWDADKLREYIDAAISFKKQHNVRMIVGEFGVVRWAEGREVWVKDLLTLFEVEGFDWAYHSFSGWNGWNPSFMADEPESRESYGMADSEVLRILKKNWERNFE